MKITTEIVKQLNPCDDRFNNFTQHYPDYNGDLENFITLENITYKDKVWVITRFFTKVQNVKWSILCASKVLSIFESAYPNDNRPRKALEAAEAWLNESTKENRIAVRNAAYAAANAAYAADSAAYAVYAVAYAAAYAAADAANAVYAADSAANSAAYARNTEEEVNLSLMLECV